MTSKAVTTCSECGKSFDLAPSDGKTTFVMPALLDPTEYACSIKCFKVWKTRKQPNPAKFDPKR